MLSHLLLMSLSPKVCKNQVFRQISERNLRLHTVLRDSVGETHIASIDEFSPVSCGCKVFLCHREHQLLTRVYQPKIGRLAFLNEAGIWGLVDALSAALFRLAAGYHVGKLLLFLWAEWRGVFNATFLQAKSALVLALVNRRGFHFESPQPQ